MGTYITTVSSQEEMITVTLGDSERIAIAVHLGTSKDSNSLPIYQVLFCKQKANLENIILDELKRKYPAYRFTCDNII